MSDESAPVNSQIAHGKLQARAAILQIALNEERE
jgi:hypothetical protein